MGASPVTIPTSLSHNEGDNKKYMTLKEFITQANIVDIMKKDVLSKLIELEAIENYLNVMLGIELEITVKPSKQKEGRYYGKSLINPLSQ